MSHACLLIESAQASVLVDPLISLRGPDQNDRPSFVDLPDHIDALLITHAHLDHLDIETLLALRHRAEAVCVPRSSRGNIVDPSLKDVLVGLGFRNVYETDPAETIDIDDITITCLPFLGEHGDLDVAGKCTWAVSRAGASVVCLADASPLDADIYASAVNSLGRIEAMFVGMKGEGSPLTFANGPYLAFTPTERQAATRRTNGAGLEGAR